VTSTLRRMKSIPRDRDRIQILLFRLRIRVHDSKMYLLSFRTVHRIRRSRTLVDPTG
jgi:hypothetical protein